jgi:eukaryotic-like serine/threonine-protein kinase
MTTELPIGHLLRNRYKIIEKKGQGFFGVTYIAKDVDLPNNHQCIVKHLQPQSSNSQVIEIATRLFIQEAEHLYSVPNLRSRFPQSGNTVTCCVLGLNHLR